VNELSLFSGAGGGVLGTKLLGWKSVGYVEWEPYCQQVLAQRIEDGFLDEAPIFGDIDHFIESGAAKKYQGFVDVVTAGFPCQPFSVAGNREGENDPRNKWPQTIQCIRDLGPRLRYALLENVPGLLNSGYFGEILSSLAQAGFDAKWVVLGADDVGAPHRRKRLWIKATSQDPERSGRLHREHEEGRIQVWEQRESGSRGGERVSGDSPEVADSGSSRLAYPSRGEGGEEWDGRLHPSEEEQAGQHLECGSQGQSTSYWKTEPNVGRVAHGVASRVDRLKALGNGQVPAVAATAWTILSTGT
jgi:DNA (cytosine-5)-methyltransferase 1